MFVTVSYINIIRRPVMLVTYCNRSQSQLFFEYSFGKSNLTIILLFCATEYFLRELLFLDLQKDVSKVFFFFLLCGEMPKVLIITKYYLIILNNIFLVLVNVISQFFCSFPINISACIKHITIF